MMASALLAALSVHGQQPAKDATNPLVGTWTWVETVNSDTKERTDLRTKPERLFVVISDTHSIYGMIDGSTMQLKKVNFGCSYTLESSKWVEKWDFGPNAGKTFTFDWKMEGDKLLKIPRLKGRLNSGRKAYRSGKIQTSALIIT